MSRIVLVNERRRQVWELKTGQWVRRGAVWFQIAQDPEYLGGDRSDGRWMRIHLVCGTFITIEPGAFVCVRDAERGSGA